MSATLIAMHNHRITRERAAAELAGRYAVKFGLDPIRRARLIADTRALVHVGHSVAWSLHIARRVARRAATTPRIA